MHSTSDIHEHPAKRCAKCLMPMSDPDWIVNKDMAYCIDCASLLHLGESKESRMFSDMHDPIPEGNTESTPGAALDPHGRPRDNPGPPDPGPDSRDLPEDYDPP